MALGLTALSPGAALAAFPATINLSALDGTNGFRLSGVAAGDYSGAAVSAAGDVNGDGVDDLLIGAPGRPYGPFSGASSSYVVFGGVGVGSTGQIELSALNGTNGFRLSGAAAFDHSGFAVSTAGDVNGDGMDDLIIGAYGANANGFDSGASYVVFGGVGVGSGGSLELWALNGTNGFRLSGVAAGDHSGRAVSTAGDVNGDRVDDLLIGAPFADPNGHASGASYVVFGGAGVGSSGNIELWALDGRNGFRLSGVAASDYSGRAVSTAGDVNGDRVDDLLIGAPNATSHGFGSGASYVVFGGAGVGSSGNIELSALDGRNGFRLSGVAHGDRLGEAVNTAGDVNGDGVGDLLIGAPHPGPFDGYSGVGYVVFGGAGVGSSGNIELWALDGRNGFRLSGVAFGDRSGHAVSTAGDVNGDGLDDVLIGAYGADPNGARSGASYVVFGNAIPPPPLPAVTCNGLPATIVGTSDSDTLVGTAGNDVIHGQDGNDRISGLGGNDVLCGGPGQDRLYGGPGRDRLLGQEGRDVLNGGGGRDRCDGGRGTDTATRCEQPRGMP